MRRYVEPRVSTRSQRRVTKATKKLTATKRATTKRSTIPTTSSSRKQPTKIMNRPTRVSTRLEKKKTDLAAKKAEEIAEKLENSSLVYNLVSQQRGNPYSAIFSRDPRNRLDPAKGVTQVLIKKRSDMPLMRYLGGEPQSFSVVFGERDDPEGEDKVESVRSRAYSELAIFGHEYESIDELNAALSALESSSDGEDTDTMELDLDEPVSSGDTAAELTLSTLRLMI